MALGVGLHMWKQSIDQDVTGTGNHIMFLLFDVYAFMSPLTCF